VVTSSVAEDWRLSFTLRPDRRRWNAAGRSRASSLRSVVSPFPPDLSRLPRRPGGRPGLRSLTLSWVSRWRLAPWRRTSLRGDSELHQGLAVHAASFRKLLILLERLERGLGLRTHDPVNRPRRPETFRASRPRVDRPNRSRTARASTPKSSSSDQGRPRRRHEVAHATFCRTAPPRAPRESSANAGAAVAARCTSILLGMRNA
jgi:hypothetical protein